MHGRISLSRFSSSTSTCPSLSSFPSTSCTPSCTLSSTTRSSWKACATPLTRGVTTLTTSPPPSQDQGIKILGTPSDIEFVQKLLNLISEKHQTRFSRIPLVAGTSRWGTGNVFASMCRPADSCGVRTTARP